MKKTVIAIIITGILGIAVLCIPSVFVSTLPKAGVTSVRTVEYADSVVAVGEVQKLNSNSVKADMPLVVSEVLVSKGENITEGQPILTVDKAATAAKMMEIDNYAALADIGAGSTVTSYNDLIMLIPDKVASTVTGTIEEVSVTNGSYVISGTNILTIISSDGLVINADISEKAISKVAVGQNVIITGSGFSGQKYHGIVEEISNVAKKQYVGTNQDTYVQAKVRFTDADSKIRVGYSAKIKILTSPEKSISILPYEAVMQDEEGSEYVYVFKSGIAVRKDIETGAELGDGVEVKNGIDLNDKIITSPQEIKDGGYVNIEN